MVQPTSTTDKPCSSKPEPTAEDLTAIDELLSTGKRHYVCQEHQLALDCFVELCKQLATFYGETAYECAEAYLYYGKCLLELARIENGVLGHAVKETRVLGNDEDGEESETANTDNTDQEDTEELTKEELRANVESAMREGNLYNDGTTEDESTADEDDDNDEDDDGTKKDGEDSTKPEETTTNKEAAKGEESTDAPMDQDAAVTTDAAGDDNVDDLTEEATDGEDDVTNMQLSWEMFELTVWICNKQLKRVAKKDETKKILSNLAEAKYCLAQISMESEHYEEAIKDFTVCLQYYTDFVEDKHDRRLAEVNYNIALAFSFDKKFDEAIEKFKLAVEILEARIKDLESKVKEAGDKGGKDKATTEQEEWNKEINELRDLVLLDMDAKIEDAEEMKKQAKISIQVMKDAATELFSAVGTSGGFDQGFEAGFDTPSDTTPTEVVHDCTNKIRTKRKPEDDESGIESKKMKNMNGDAISAKLTNGDAKLTTNGDVNGNAVKKQNGHSKPNGVVAAES